MNKIKKLNNKQLIIIVITLSLIIIAGYFGIKFIMEQNGVKKAIKNQDFSLASIYSEKFYDEYDNYICKLLDSYKNKGDALVFFNSLTEYVMKENDINDFETWFQNKYSKVDENSKEAKDVIEKLKEISNSGVYTYNQDEDGYDFKYFIIEDIFDTKLKDKYIDVIYSYVLEKDKNKEYNIVSYDMINLLTIFTQKYKNKSSLYYDVLNGKLDKFKETEKITTYYQRKELGTIREEFNNLNNYKNSKQIVKELDNALKWQGLWKNNTRAFNISYYDNKAYYSDANSQSGTYELKKIDEDTFSGTSKNKKFEDMNFTLKDGKLIVSDDKDFSMELERVSIEMENGSPFTSTKKSSSSSSSSASYNKNDKYYSNSDKNNDGKINGNEFQDAVKNYLDDVMGG